MYWWSSEIADLRTVCNNARRQYTRYRRRRRNSEEVAAQLYETYRETKKSLQLAIRKAKAQAWQVLLKTLDEDP